MLNSLIPYRFLTFPESRTPFEEDLWDDMFLGEPHSGISIYEDDENIYVETALPGIEQKEIDVTFDNGILRVKGEKKEEKEKNYYRKATRSFSYRISVPGEVDKEDIPEATYKNGMVTFRFKKVQETQPKKIEVKLAT